MMIKHIRHFLDSVKHTKQGLIATYHHEMAFKEEVIVLLIMLPVVYFLEVSWFERSLLISSWLLVMAMELLNTSIESAIDRIGFERHELSGRAKDQGSAAVAVSIIIAILIWCGVLL